MSKFTYKDPVVYLLMHPHSNIIKHLVIIPIILVIAIDAYYNRPVEELQFDKFYFIFFYCLVFGFVLYSNIYIGVSRYLLKNKLKSYFGFISVVVVLALFMIILLQSTFVDFNQALEYGYLVFAINCISSFILMVLFMAGTTTIMLFRYWINDEKRIGELQAANLETELESLKNQINPHFLFNMLNNVNVLIKKGSDDAPVMLAKLEDLLRYQINDSSEKQVQLSSDIHFLNDFLNLEKIRRDKFEFFISKEGNIHQISLPPMLFIPFVENAIKHNPDIENLSYVYLWFIVRNGWLEFRCQNSKPVHIAAKESKEGGIGLKNIRRRLELLYPDKHSLEIKDEKTTFTVKLRIKL